MAGLMAMMAALALAALVVAFSGPISQSLGNEAGEPVTDIGAVSQLNAYTSNYAYDFLRQATRYSLHNESYELGQKGGEIDWKSSEVSTDLSKTYECSDENPLEEINCRLQEDTAERTANYGWDTSSRCSTKITGEETNVTEQSTLFRSSYLELDCEIKQRKMHRTVKDLGLNVSTERVRFQTLSHTAYSYMNELESSWSAGSYSGDATSCGSPSDSTYAEAEEEAADDADSDIENSFDSVSVSEPGGVDIDSSILDIPEELDYDTDPENFEEAEQDFEVTEESCCETVCSEEGGCTCVAYEHEVEATVEPEESQAELTVEDTKNKVLLNNGWENIEFVVENYVHSFD